MFRDKDILITGGAGFIGSHVTEQLAGAGANVLVVDDLATGKQRYVPDGVELESIDVSADALHEIVQVFEPDIVLHMAAVHYVPYCNEHPKETYETNVLGTRNLLTSLEVVDPDVVLYTSSGAVYSPETSVHSEEDTPAPGDIYGSTKLVGEDLAELFHEQRGVPTVTARLFNTYGSRETNPHLVPDILEQIHAGKREISLGNLSPKRDFVHVTDVADAILTMLRNTDRGYSVYNVGSGEARSVKEVVDHVAEALGEKITIEQSTERKREADRPHLEADTSCLRSLGWTPSVTFQDGIAQLLQSN